MIRKNRFLPEWATRVCCLVLAAVRLGLAIAGPGPATASSIADLRGQGDSTAPVLSRDGQFLAFLSTAKNLVTNQHNSRVIDLFVRELKTAETVLVSRNRDGTSGGNANSSLGSLSDSGRWIAFASEASDLVADDTNGMSDVFVRDLQTQTIVLVSVNQSGAGSGNGASDSPMVSADGRFVLFESGASDLVASDANGIPDLFIRDLREGTTRLVSAGATPALAGYGRSGSGLLTPDAHWVAFSSTATNLAANQLNQWGEVFLRDLGSSQTLWASSTPELSLGKIRRSSMPAISDDGQVIVFKKVPQNTDGSAFLIHQDRRTGQALVVATNVVAGNPDTVDWAGPVMSADGRWVAYEERAGNGSQIRLWDALTGTNLLVSVGVNAQGTGAASGSSASPLISADGRVVAFLSNSTNLVGTAAPNNYQLYAREIPTGITRLLSFDTTPQTRLQGDVGFASMSADGQSIAFQARGENGRYSVFVWHAETGDLELGSRQLADTDADQLPDAWETEYFGNLARDGSGDADHDGLTDLQELEAGTNPANPESTLRTFASLSLPATHILLEWTTVPGMFYQVQSASNFNPPIWTDQGLPMLATSATASCSCPVSAAQQSYYRVLAVEP